jgi:hypothetical protein
MMYGRVRDAAIVRNERSIDPHPPNALPPLAGACRSELRGIVDKLQHAFARPSARSSRLVLSARELAKTGDDPDSTSGLLLNACVAGDTLTRAIRDTTVVTKRIPGTSVYYVNPEDVPFDSDQQTQKRCLLPGFEGRS